MLRRKRTKLFDDPYVPPERIYSDGNSIGIVSFCSFSPFALFCTKLIGVQSLLKTVNFSALACPDFSKDK